MRGRWVGLAAVRQLSKSPGRVIPRPVVRCAFNDDRLFSTASNGGEGGRRETATTAARPAPRQMVGVSPWWRLRTKAMLWLHTRFTDPRFCRTETEEGARIAYATVAALAFGPLAARDSTRLGQLCSAEIVTKLRKQASEFGEMELIVHDVVHAELIGIGSCSGARVAVDVRFLTYESVHDTAIDEKLQGEERCSSVTAAVLRERRGVGSFDQHDRLEDMLEAQINILKRHLGSDATPSHLQERLEAAMTKLQSERAALSRPSKLSLGSRYLISSTWRFETDLDPSDDQCDVEWEVTEIERHRVAQAMQRPTPSERTTWHTSVQVPWPYAGEW